MPPPPAPKQPAPVAAATTAPTPPEHARARELLSSSSPDDGATAAVAGVPAGWGAARLSAFLERTGVKPLSVDKAQGETRAVARFAGPADRAKARQALIEMGPAAAAGLTLLLPLPGSSAPAPAPSATAVAGGKRPAPIPAQENAQVQAQAQQQPSNKKVARASAAGNNTGDVRAAVCPWHDVPYGEQLRRKATTVLEALRRAADGVQGIHDSRAAAGNAQEPPAWLAAAGKRPGGAAAPLPAVVRAPQLEAYRSKSEFSVGRDLQGRVAVGFQHGAFKDGVTAVGDASRCRHTSAAGRAYAALLQQFLRGGGGEEGAAGTTTVIPATGAKPSQLDVWDKGSNAGFWRLLVVREGRAKVFLPLPGEASPASPATLADVPLERWIVRLPEAQFGGLAEEEAQQQQQHPAAAAFASLLASPGTPALADVPPLLEAAPAAAAAAATTTNAAEPRAPPPDELMLALQVNPLHVKNRADPAERARLAKAAASELRAVAAFFFAAAASPAASSSPTPFPPPTSLLVQYHFGVSNAAPADAPLMPLEKAALEFDAMAAEAEGAAAPTINALPGAPPLASGAGSVAGDPQCLHETLCGLRFRVSPAAFFQVNTPATLLLYRLVGDWASAAPAGGNGGAAPPQLLLDVCCGTGTIGVSLADRAQRVVGVDSSAPAVEDARRNAEANAAAKGKCSWVAGTAEKELPRLLAEAGVAALPAGAVVAVADPPRAGLHKNVLRALLAAKSLRRLVLVSCNPASLADNLVDLCRPAWSRPGGGGGKRGGKRGGGGGGNSSQEVEVPADAAPFRPVIAAAMDLFPHTPHVEAVVLLERD